MNSAVQGEEMRVCVEASWTMPRLCHFDLLEWEKFKGLRDICDSLSQTSRMLKL